MAEILHLKNKINTVEPTNASVKKLQIAIKNRLRLYQKHGVEIDVRATPDYVPLDDDYCLVLLNPKTITSYTQFSFNRDVAQPGYILVEYKQYHVHRARYRRRARQAHWSVRKYDISPLAITWCAENCLQANKLCIIHISPGYWMLWAHQICGPIGIY